MERGREREGEREREGRRERENNTLLLKDKDLCTSVCFLFVFCFVCLLLFYKSVPDDKHSNTQHAKHEYK